MFGNGESGTGGVLLGNVSLGKAVGMRLGKVVSGIVWRGELGSVSVRQSCLGTFRCGAVKFGEARQSGQGGAGQGRLGGARQSRLAKVSFGTAARGEFGQSWLVEVSNGKSC